MAEARRERKVVTVLFADLVGFTSRSEQLDPEDVDAVLRPYHERLRDCGSQLSAAFAKLQTGSDADLRVALDFYRSVGAPYYVRQAETRLAAIA